MNENPRIELLGESGADPIGIVAYDPAWRAGFVEWRVRLLRAVPAAVRIDHVGSTAVPGLPAKPTIDIQVSVVDVEDESVYVPGIESTGVVLRMREPGHRYFRPPAGEPRVVQIHVCGIESEWEVDHLLFRDYLRGHPEDRDAYATLKLELAEQHRDDRLAYTDAKTQFILTTLDKAHRSP
jgi:GrpB-like predicted nucleotidyltransferase (UPF0157 family)